MERTPRLEPGQEVSQGKDQRETVAEVAKESRSFYRESGKQVCQQFNSDHLAGPIHPWLYIPHWGGAGGGGMPSSGSYKGEDI